MTTEKMLNKSRVYFLIADADSAKRESIVAMLKAQEYTHFDQASDGASAFHILKRRPINFIIAAWDMPQMSGMTLLKVVSADEELFSIPFILVCSTINRDMVVEAGKFGVTAIMLEPLKAGVLDQKIAAILTSAPDSATSKIEDLFTKAKQLVAAGNLDAALAIYKEVLAMGEDADVYYNIGYIKAAQGKYDEAIIAFRKAVMINNFHGRAYKMMGQVYIKLNEQAEAEKCYEKAGKIFLERNMDDEAEEVFKEVLRINPQVVNIYNSLGIIYRRRHNYAEAINLYKRAIDVDPDDENILFNLGRAYLDAKNVEEAKKSFLRALEKNPGFTEAKKMLQAIEMGF